MNDLSSALEGIKELGKTPSGKVRITMPKFVYQHFFKDHYADFYRLYPEIELEISVSDAAMDILKEGFDLGIRFGDRVDEGMVARALTPAMKEAFFASPEYIQEHGLPRTPEQLSQHKLVQYRFITSNQLVPVLLDNQGETINIDMQNSIIVNDTDLMVDATLKGLGIGRMVEPAIKDLLESGELVPVLTQHGIRIQHFMSIFIEIHKRQKESEC